MSIELSFFGSDYDLDEVNHLLVEMALGNRVAWSKEDSDRVGPISIGYDLDCVGGGWQEIKNSAGGPWWLETLVGRDDRAPSGGWNGHLDLMLEPDVLQDENGDWKVEWWMLESANAYFAYMIASILRLVPGAHAAASMDYDSYDGFNSESRLFVYDRERVEDLTFSSEDGNPGRYMRRIEKEEAKWKTFRDELRAKTVREAFERRSMPIVSIEDAKAGDIVTFGRHPESRIPVAWRVLASGSAGALLLSESILANMKFGRKGCGWEKSEARKWLNGDFLGSYFDIEELARVVPYGPGAFGGRTVSDGLAEGDQVFCLSLNDAKKYLKGVPAKIAKTTPYVNGWTEPHSWWLRSPGSPDYHFAMVEFDGRISAKGCPPKLPSGIRPAMFVRYKRPNL